MHSSKLVIALSLMSFSVPALAQPSGVVMRRPLPVRQGGSIVAPAPTPTPTPGGTPAPSPTPTPTPGETPAPCPDGHSCSSPVPEETENSVNSGYGWYVHCSPPALADCERVTERVNPDSSVSYDYEQVDSSLCNMQQSAAGKALVQREGFNLPGGASYDFSEMCSRPVSIAVGFCMDTLQVQCVTLSPTTGEEILEPDVSKCVAQNASSPGYQSLISMLPPELQDLVVPPSEIEARNGKPCTVTRPTAVIVGTSCADPARACQGVTYSYDPGSFPHANVAVENISVLGPYDAVQCTSQTYDPAKIETLRSLGMAPYGESCTEGVDAYVARGKCTTSVSYGDQNQVDTAFSYECFAVSNWHGTPSITKVANSFCETPADPQQQTIINDVEQVTKTYKDPKRLDRTCSAGSNGSWEVTNPDGTTTTVRLNFQMDVVPVSQYPSPNETWDGWPSMMPGTVDYFESSYSGAPHFLVEQRLTYPYVCTDVDRGTAWRPAYFENMEVASTYPVTRWPCAEQRAAMVAAIASDDIQQTCIDEMMPVDEPRAAQCFVNVVDDNAGRISITRRRWFRAPW